MTEHTVTVEESEEKTRNPWVWRSILIAVVLIILAPFVAFMIAYLLVDVPKADQLVNKQVTEIYAGDDETQLARIVPPEGNRVVVPLSEIPESMKDATLAAEDREFYTNPGFSITGFGRAIIGQLTGDGSKGGGSTITQQYVKIAVVGNERSYERKLKELVYSAKMANEWSKEQVLESYLNTIYLGRNAYGVAAASQAYFAKDFTDLTPEESALLAAAIQRPSTLDPWNNRAEAEQRWNYVMDGMVEIGAMSPGARAEARFPEVIDPATVQSNTEATGTNGLIKDRVLAELQGVGISEQDVQTRGLRVTTTIDTDAQNAAQAAVENNMQGEPENLRTAVVSINPKTGGVSAYYGGEDPAGWDYAIAPLQTGSTFKIFALAAALEQGIPLSQYYSSAPVQTGDVTVTNSEGQSCGTCTIAQALKQSLNTSFIRLQDDLKNGPDDTAAMAHRLGVAESLPGLPHTLKEENGHTQLGVVLGQYQSRPFDLAVALATLANEGVYNKTHFVQKVVTNDGEVLYEHEGESERIVDEEVANSVIHAMKPIAAYSRGHALNGRESAAKTGTAQLGDTGQNKDAWMIGATPQLSTAVWVGTDDGQPLLNLYGGKIWGSGLPSDIWKSTMDAALANADYESFPVPTSNLGYVAPPAPPAPATPVAPPEPTTTEPTETSEPAEPAEPELPEIPDVPLPAPAPPAEPAQPAQPALPNLGDLLPG
ncbi:transglycosylase domain-containing protein [Corynebacterium sp. TAE3-ERU2]|uniref:transglycosylase domain-containing protein n=1 Tax=Corynebacterium sp. TAE3-ERU2 TaxID=2849497 RepID=UPI001C49749A|nr:penicillin-binding protein [Corynebacterium sp. TAE3-ERU2]